MADARVTDFVVCVLGGVDPNLRVSEFLVEVMGTKDSSIQVTEFLVEVLGLLISPSVPYAVVSEFLAETLGNVTPQIQVSEFLVEVLAPSNQEREEVFDTLRTVKGTENTAPSVNLEQYVLDANGLVRQIPYVVFGEHVQFLATLSPTYSKELLIPTIVDMNNEPVENTNSFPGKLVYTLQQTNPNSNLVIQIQTKDLNGNYYDLYQRTLNDKVGSGSVEAIFNEKVNIILTSDTETNIGMIVTFQS